MGRNKKDATQDVLNLYNQMQEDENWKNRSMLLHHLS